MDLFVQRYLVIALLKIRFYVVVFVKVHIIVEAKVHCTHVCMLMLYLVCSFVNLSVFVSLRPSSQHTTSLHQMTAGLQGGHKPVMTERGSSSIPREGEWKPISWRWDSTPRLLWLLNLCQKLNTVLQWQRCKGQWVHVSRGILQVWYVFLAQWLKGPTSTSVGPFNLQPGQVWLMLGWPSASSTPEIWTRLAANCWTYFTFLFWFYCNRDILQLILSDFVPGHITGCYL